MHTRSLFPLPQSFIAATRQSNFTRRVASDERESNSDRLTPHRLTVPHASNWRFNSTARTEARRDTKPDQKERSEAISNHRSSDPWKDKKGKFDLKGNRRQSSSLLHPVSRSQNRCFATEDVSLQSGGLPNKIKCCTASSALPFNRITWSTHGINSIQLIRSGLSLGLQLFDLNGGKSLPDVGLFPTPSEVPEMSNDLIPSGSSTGTSQSSSCSTTDNLDGANETLNARHTDEDTVSRRTRLSFNGVVDGYFEQLCRQCGQREENSVSNDCQAHRKAFINGSGRRRNRIIFCRVCKLFKPRSTRARFQSCDHIACYDCVRIALHVEFWAVIKNYHTDTPRASCPVCRKPLDWSTIKPYIVLAEEAKYWPVLTLAASGKDIPPNTPSHRYLSGNEQDAKLRYEEAAKVVRAFFPSGVPTELLVSDVTDFALPMDQQNGCMKQVFGD